jgi:hypothetical protein
MPSDMPPAAAQAPRSAYFGTLWFAAGFFVVLALLLMAGNFLPDVPAV